MWLACHIVEHIVVGIVVDIVGLVESGHIVVGTVVGIVACIGLVQGSGRHIVAHKLAYKMVDSMLE